MVHIKKKIEKNMDAYHESMFLLINVQFLLNFSLSDSPLK